MLTAQIRKIYKYHKSRLRQNPSHTQRATAQKFNISDKEVHIAIVVTEHLHDPEIALAETPNHALRILNSRKRKKKEHIIQNLFL